MRKHLFLFWLVLFSPFCSAANYAVNFDWLGRSFTVSSHKGIKNTNKITFCSPLQLENISIQVDCDLPESERIQSASFFATAFNQFTLLTKASVLSKYYQFSETSFCIFLVDEAKSYHERINTRPCLSFYVPIPPKSNEFKPNRIAIAIASIAHEQFHLLYPPFARNGQFNRLLANEYAAYLITLNSYELLYKQLGLPTIGSWSLDTLQEFRKAEKLPEYCEDFQVLRELNKSSGSSFDSVFGAVLAHAFLESLQIEQSFLPFYFKHELQDLEQSDLSDNSLLHRTNICTGKIPQFNSLRFLLLDISFDAYQKGNLENDNTLISLFLSSDYSPENVNAICDKKDFYDLCSNILLENIYLRTDLQTDTHLKHSLNGYGKSNVSSVAHFILDESHRYRDNTDEYVIDTGASSVVWPDGYTECSLSGKKKVRNLHGQLITLEKCTYDSHLGIIWTSKNQTEKVLPLHAFFHDHESITFERRVSDGSPSSIESMTVPFIYLNGFITFQVEDNLVNYCLDTGSRFSHFTSRFQERFLFYPHNFTGNKLFTREIQGKIHTFIEVPIPAASPLLLKSNPVYGASQCDIVMGADLLGKYHSIQLNNNRTMTLTW